jgi:integrase
MARKLRAPKIKNKTDRLQLPVQRKPHAFTTIAPGIALGYRRTQGAGSWVLRCADGRGGAWTKNVGIADDDENADGEHVFTFWQAAERARQMARGQDGDAGRPATMATALDLYENDLRARGGDVSNASRVRGHLTPALLSKPVALLSATELRRWRDALIATGMASATALRIRNAARAALNLAADLDKRIVDRSAWTVGLAGLSDTSTPVNKVLADADVLRLVAESYALDPQFGLFVDVLAVTGTRTSQACRLLVGDLQAEGSTPRLLMPSSRKGRGKRKITRKPVPIPNSLARKLKQAAGKRASDAPLLTRANGSAWSTHDRKPYNLFGEVARRCGIEATAYHLRHSSIGRSLLAGTPARLVATLHDTSIPMLEKVYARFIADSGDAVARHGLLDTAAPAADPNVVPLRR